MEQESKRLENLPPSTDEFWKDSETEVYTLPKGEKCEHEFKSLGSWEVECIRCGAGYVLGVLDKLRDGHIYHNNVLVI